MLIRCEKCSTLYELDDNMLPPGGAPVQCSRCQFVFTAYPDRRAGGGAGGSPPAPEESASEAYATQDAVETTTSTREGERAEAGQGADGVAGRGSRPFTDAPEPGAAGEEAVPAEAGLALVSAEASEAPAEDSAARPAGGEVEEGSSHPIGAAAAGGAKARSVATRSAEGKALTQAVNGASSDDEPKFTADGRPIRKVPFPDDAAASPRTASARPSLQTAPPAKSGERARLPWLVPVVVLLVLAFAALVGWRLLATRSAGDEGQKPAEGHSSLVPDGRPQGRQGAGPLSGAPPRLAVCDGKATSHSWERA